MASNRYLLFAITATATLAFAMQFSMVSVALPELTTDLDAPLRWTGWVVTVFLIGQVVSMPLAGRLAERYGARNLFIVGFIFFSLSSFGAAISPNVWVLIATRALQGAAGGVLLPAAMGMIGEAFKENRARPIGLLGSIAPIGGIIGPSLGGVIVDHLGWRWTFALNIPLGPLVLVAGLLFMPRGTTIRRSGSIDYAGIGLLGLTITSLVFALTELGRPSAETNYPLVGGAALVSVVSLGLLGLRLTRAAHPVIDLDLLRRHEFLFANLLSFFFGAALLSIFSLLPLYVQSRYGMNASEAGALVTPRAAAMVVAAMVASMALPLTGYRRPIVFGILLMSSSMVVLSFGIKDPTVLGISLSSFVWIGIVAALMGISFGIVTPSLNNASLDHAPDRIPAVNGLRGMFMNLGGVVGVSVVLLIVSHSSEPAVGLERSFVALAVLAAAATVLALGIPEIASRRTAREAPTPTQPVPPTQPVLSPDLDQVPAD